MATGAKMSFNPYQNGKYDSFLQTSQKDVEITQELHLKMSKKIAQLTKVIYALNTKNDESDSVLQSLRDQHEEEIQQILAETKDKMTLYKDRLDEESNYHAAVAALQAKVAEYEAKHVSIQNKFSLYKAEMKDQQEKEQATHSLRLLHLSQEIMKVKDNFADHLNNFKFWKEKIAAEHAVTLAELKRKHQKELEDLQDIVRNHSNDYVNEYIDRETELKKDIEILKTQIEILESDKTRLEENHAIKLKEAADFHEKELEAACSNRTLKYAIEIEELKKEMDILKLGLDSSDRELKMRIDLLINQLAETEAELTESKQKVHSLEGEMSNKNSSTIDLTNQLRELKEELTKTAISLKNVETELAQSKKRCSNLDSELIQKSSKLDKLQTSNNQKDITITCQQNDIELLTAQVRQLNLERTSLLTERQSLTSDQSNALTCLQQALEDLKLEKETLQVRSQKQIESFQQQIKKQAQQHSEEVAKKMEEAEQKYLEGIDEERRSAADSLMSLKQELAKFYEVETSQVIQERDFLKTELNHAKAVLTSKLSDSENEVERLKKLVKESEQGLGSTSEQLISLKDDVSKLKAEHDKAQSELSASNAKVTDLQAEVDKLNLLHEAEVVRLNQAMSQCMEAMTRELAQKWTETMKSENSKLSQELIDQSESEKRTALLQLSRQKDEEIAAARAEYEAQLECLKSQIEELQSNLDSAKLEGDVDKARLKYELERERSRLSKEMLEAANDYSSKMVAMEKLHMNEKEFLRTQSEQEKNDLESKLKQQHMEELQSQMTAHKAVLESAIKLEERHKQEALDNLRSKFQNETEVLQNKLEQKLITKVDALKQTHSNEIRVARMELDRAVEISKQKEMDYLMQREELQAEIANREQHIKNLKDHVEQLEQEIRRLKKEIDAKALEVQQAHRQTSQQLILQEDKLTRQNQTAQDNLNADHLREKQTMLTQFSSAQDLLKDKISALHIELEESHQRYLRRESRRDDLELIETLRCELSEREIRIKDLIDEKRFYQLELVNRETNFNKVFNANPNVGILNPFQKPKKKGDKPGKLVAGASSTMGSGSSTGHQRLDPLPGSPLHDGLLNPTKPLPQPSFTKKIAN